MSDSSASRASSPTTPQSNRSDQLTPRRKVQALLAQFNDSDSDTTSATQAVTRQSVEEADSNLGHATIVNRDDDPAEDDSDEEILSRSKVAARLLGQSSKLQPDTDKQTINKTPLSDGHNQTAETDNHNFASSDDEISAALPRRRFLVQRNSSPTASNEIQHVSKSRSFSPMFFPSPTSTRHSPNPHAGQNHTGVEQQHNGRSKFMVLVEKHRKERLAKEAADIAKRAVGLDEDEQDTTSKRGPRGSSPADDSEEELGSDDGAAQRISKQARPTRKASKKAIEEMNRETQRMSRNLQLAHQAKTKKKITKESLLARFNVAPAEVVTQESREPQSSDVSSAAASESEDAHQHHTPPTSPLQEPEAKNLGNYSTIQGGSAEMFGAIAPNDDIIDDSDHMQLEASTNGNDKIQEYIRNNRTVFSPDPESVDVQVNLAIPKPVEATCGSKVSRSNMLRSKVLSATLSDSDSEIEIVKDKGSRRKYAAFETLPKRKAKEMPSHLALRSLAHLMSNGDSRQSLNTAQMETSLRRKARMQALEERRLRIEDLKAKGIVIQSAEERERDQQEVEDLVERARQEAAEIQKREKELAKKDGTYVKDHLDDEDDESDDADFEDDADEDEDDEASGSEDELQREATYNIKEHLIDDEVAEGGSDEEEETEVDEGVSDKETDASNPTLITSKALRKPRVISDDEDDDDEESVIVDDKENQSPVQLPPAKTPQSLTRSARKAIPGLQMSDDLPMGLSQAFAATMAESEGENSDFKDQDEDSFDMVGDLPSPNVAPAAPLQRLDSIDMVSDSQPIAQTQPLNLDLNLSQSLAIPESPAHGLGISVPHFTPSQRPFELTQDEGYLLSPFSGSRFAETPTRNAPHSTVETLILPPDALESPVVSRKGKLRRGRVVDDDDDEAGEPAEETAFQVMKRAATRKTAQEAFDKSKSEARRHFDEAAEESEDEYAGLGGASDDDADEEENEEDRRMIDEDTQVGVGDAAKLAGFYADRERERDEKDVSKLLKDITTGALRRKRGIGDDLDLSDEEDAAAQRREAKRREFARMRRELLKDEAVGKIAEDKKKEAFLRSIEDREDADGDDDDDEDNHLAEAETRDESESQTQDPKGDIMIADSQGDSATSSSTAVPLHTTTSSKLNRLPSSLRRTNANVSRKPSNLAEIRESVSFLIEEPDSQAAMVDLGLSDSEDEPEAYVDLDRHLRDAENDENVLDDSDADDLGDFIVDDDKDDSPEFRKPELPTKERAPFSERRTRHENVVDRLSLLRQASSSSSESSMSSKMAFFSSKPGSGSVNGVPSLLRRATTNSSLGSMSGRDKVSATGVSTNNGASRTERGNAAAEKEFIRKGSNGRRNAVNFQARTTLKEEKMSQRAGIVKANAKSKKKAGNGFLNGLFRGDSWS